MPGNPKTRNQRVNGINPLSYLGVNAETPPGFYVDDRDPTTSDVKGFYLGDIWLNYTDETIWMVVNLEDNIATWISFGGSDFADSFITDSGTAVPVMGDLNVLGGENITTTGAGDTVTIEVDGTTEHAIQVGSATGGLTSLAVALNGEIPIGSTGADPVIANISSGNNITVSNGAGTISVAVTGTTDHALQVGNASGSLTSLAAATNGQIPIGSTGSDPVIASLTAGTGIAITPGAGSITIATTGAGGTIVTKFTASGTWTKNATSTWVKVLMWTPGGGGASGAKGLTMGATSGGGGGGAGGSFLQFESPASLFSATETVTIGAGGTGGAAVAVDNTGFNVGTDGGTTLFANYVVTPGASNTVPTTAGGVFAFVNNIYSSINAIKAPNNGVDAEGNNFGTFSGEGGAGGAGDDAQDTGFGGFTASGKITSALPSGGGGGGDFNTGPFAGGTGGSLYGFNSTLLIAGGTSGAVETNGGNGNPALVGVTGGLFTAGTGGGGGGGSDGLSANAGSGGNGGIPGGAGGGGGAVDNGAFNSGAGGNGARAEIWVIEF